MITQIPIPETGGLMTPNGEAGEKAASTLRHTTDDQNVRFRTEMSVENYRIVADNTYDWEFWVSPDGKFLYVSPSCSRITGYNPAAFFDDPGLFVKIIYEEDRPLVERHWEQCDLGREHGRIEFRITTCDGAIRWIEHICNPVFDETGVFAGSRGSNRDITERKLAMEISRNSEQMLHMVLEHFPGIVFWKDVDSNYLGCNQAFAAGAGLQSPADMIGKTDYDLVWAATEAGKYCADDNDVMTSGEPKLHIIEMQHQIDGRLAWFDTSKLPLRDSGGSVIGVLGTANDITQQKIATSEIIHTNLLLTAILESSPEINVVALDKEYRYLAFNSKHKTAMAQLCGTEIIVGMNMLDIMTSAAARSDMKAHIDRALAGENFVLNEQQGAENEPCFFWMEYWSPIFGIDRNITGVTCFTLNITTRKRLEQQLLQSQKLEGIGMMAGGIAHDFNNLLGVILGYADLFHHKVTGRP